MPVASGMMLGMARGMRRRGKVGSWVEDPPLWSKITLLAAVTAVAVVLSGAAWKKQNPTSADAGATPGYVAAAEDSRPRAIAIGDSYAEGTGAADNQGLVAQAANAMGWRFSNFALGGTGYVNPGPAALNRVPFAEVVPDACAQNPDILLIVGSLNDRVPVEVDKSATATDVGAAASAMYDAVAAQCPKTKTVVVGPFWPNEDPTPGMLAIEQEVRRAAQDGGLPFVDPIAGKWITAANKGTMIGPDKTHPTQAGHDYLGAKLADALRGVPGLPATTAAA